MEGVPRKKDCATEADGYWAIPRLLLLELFAVVLLTVDTRALAVAVVLSLPDDANLLLGVAVLPARGEVGGLGGRVLRLATFPPRPVEMGKVDLDLLVCGCDRVLLLGLTIGGGEDAEGDGDSRFKIQVDCLLWARRVVFSSTFGQGRREDSSGFFLGKEVERKRERKRRTLPIGWNGLLLFGL